MKNGSANVSRIWKKEDDRIMDIFFELLQIATGGRNLLSRAISEKEWLIVFRGCAFKIGAHEIGFATETVLDELLIGAI